MSHKNPLPSNDPVIFTAKYCDTKIPEFKGNPLIEALPPISSDTDWAQKIGEFPTFNPEEREEAGHVRAYYISRLTHFFQPLPDHLELASSIERLIKQGYVSRNPNTADRGKLLQKAYEASMAGESQNTSYSAYHPIASMSLMGASGMGKSTTVERILGQFPQVIYHPDSGITQVTWLKLDCAHNGEIKELGLNFLLELDQVLGSSLRDQYGMKVHEESLLDHIKKCAVTYSLGLLVIDEMQNLSTKQTDGQEKVLNYLQTLCNTMQVPVLMMGTMKTMRLFQPNFRQARRSAAQGSHIWERRTNNQVWQLLVESLWEYQWVRNPVELDEAFTEFLYDATQGVVALLISLFILAQLYAIRTNKETLSIDIFKKVMNKYMTPVQPMITALKSGNFKRIESFDDLSLPNFDDMIQLEQESIRLSQIKKSSKSTSNNVMTTPKDEAIKTILKKGYSVQNAKRAVLEAMQQGKKTQSTIVSAALMILQPVDTAKGDHQEDGLDLRQADDPETLRHNGLIRGLPPKK